MGPLDFQEHKMAIEFNHETNDIVNSTGQVKFNGTAVGGDNTPNFWYGSRGVFGGGAGSVPSGEASANEIQYITIASTGNATDFGDLTVARHGAAAVSNRTRGVFGGGRAYYSASNALDYITIASTGNATDFGDLTVVRQFQPAGVATSGRGVFAGGSSDVIDYITIATTGDATDFGDLPASSSDMSGWSSSTRGIFHLAASGGITNTLHYITILTAGNSTDFGDLNSNKLSAGACGSTTRAIFAGGRTDAGGNPPVNTMDYITMDTTGNATDFGDLTISRYGPSGSSNATRGVFAGGYAGTTYYNTIDYVTIASTGNATDFGDIAFDSFLLAGASGQ